MFDELFAHHSFEEDADFLPLISMDEEDDSESNESFPAELPILALKNTVLFPGIVIPITVGRDKSIKAINEAYENGKVVAVLSQRDSDIENPKAKDLFLVGTVARILKLLRMPDGTTTAILQGRRRFQLVEMLEESPFMRGSIHLLEYIPAKNKIGI